MYCENIGTSTSLSHRFVSLLLSD